jgi:hypothetical protein
VSVLKILIKVFVNVRLERMAICKVTAVPEGKVHVLSAHTCACQVTRPLGTRGQLSVGLGVPIETGSSGNTLRRLRVWICHLK